MSGIVQLAASILRQFVSAREAGTHEHEDRSDYPGGSQFYLQHLHLGRAAITPATLTLAARFVRGFLDSIAPGFMAQWRAIQLCPEESPLRHESVHQLREAIVVMPFQQMHHLMNDDVLNALRGFFDEFQI